MWYQTHDSLITFNNGLGTLKTKPGRGNTGRMCWAGILSWGVLTHFWKVIKLSSVWYHMVESRSLNGSLLWVLRMRLARMDPPDLSSVLRMRVWGWPWLWSSFLVTHLRDRCGQCTWRVGAQRARRRGGVDSWKKFESFSFVVLHTVHSLIEQVKTISHLPRFPGLW